MGRAFAACLLAGALALVAPLAPQAQPAPKTYRVGFLGTASASGYVREMGWIREGLHKFGYEEGRNLLIEYRWAEGSAERMREMAAEFASLKVDAILVHNVPGALAASRATASIPIVMADGADPVAAGLAASLARPGRNVTGSTSFVPEESAKRLELLREVVPGIRRVAFLASAAPPPAFAAVKAAVEKTATSLGLELRHFAVRDVAELPAVLRAMEKAGMSALVVNNEPVLNAQASVIAALASFARLPSIGYPNFADAGGLLAYGASRPALYGRAGYFLDRIFKGAKPAEIPFEQAAKFDLIVNLRTAQSLGVPVAPAVRMRADRVIESL